MLCGAFVPGTVESVRLTPRGIGGMEWKVRENRRFGWGMVVMRPWWIRRRERLLGRSDFHVATNRAKWCLLQ